MNSFKIVAALFIALVMLLCLIQPTAANTRYINLSTASSSDSLTQSGIERLGGSDRFETASIIAKNGFTSAENVVLASADSYADALAGVPLAYALNAPILLVSGDTVNGNTADTIKALDAKKAYLLGGRAAISEDIEKSLQGSGYTTERLGGNTRYETAVLIAEKLQDVKGSKPEDIFIASGLNYPDALSASSIAALKGVPILYVTKDGKLDSSTSDYVEKSDINNAYILGGTAAVSASVNRWFTEAINVKRLGGSDRYNTSLIIAKNFDKLFSSKDTALATGTNYADALTGSVFAAKKSIPVLLTDNKNIEPNLKAYIAEKDSRIIYVFGGTSVISNSIAHSYLPDINPHISHLSVLVSSYETDDTMIMDVHNLDVANQNIEDAADIEYTSKYSLCVYDKKHDTIFYSARVDNGGATGDQLFSYDIRNKVTTQLTTDIYAINCIYPFDDSVYMIAAMQGTHHLTVAKYEISKKELLVFDSLGTWNFELMTYDIYNNRILASACLAKEQDEALDAANEAGIKYIAPDYTVFGFSDDFYNPQKVLQTDKKLVRRMAVRPDGRMFITLADSIPEWEPDYFSYILDFDTKEMTPTYNIDEGMYVTEFLYYLSDCSNIYFIGAEKDSDGNVKDISRGIYRYNLDNNEAELILKSDNGFIRSSYVL